MRRKKLGSIGSSMNSFHSKFTVFYWNISITFVSCLINNYPTQKYIFVIAKKRKNLAPYLILQKLLHALYIFQTNSLLFRYERKFNSNSSFPKATILDRKKNLAPYLILQKLLHYIFFKQILFFFIDTKEISLDPIHHFQKPITRSKFQK